MKVKGFFTTFPAISSGVVSGMSRLGCPRNARVISTEELGTMSKNNIRGIIGYEVDIGDSLSYLDLLLHEISNEISRTGTIVRGLSSVMVLAGLQSI